MESITQINITEMDLTRFVNDTGIDCVIEGQRFLNEMYVFYNNMILISALWVLITVVIFFALDFYKSIKLNSVKEKNEKEIIECIDNLIWIDLFQRLAILFLIIAGARLIQLAVWVMG